MKQDKQRLLSYKVLRDGMKVRATNTKERVSAVFIVDTVYLLGLPWLRLKVLREVSISAALLDEWFPLSYLKRQEIEWEVV